MGKLKTVNTSPKSCKPGPKKDEIFIKLPKQSRYPKKLYFRDECYRVLFKKNFKCYGETDFEKKTITIKHGLPPRALLSTFIHEVLHALECEHSIDLKHSTVYALELGILEMLMDNFL